MSADSGLSTFRDADGLWDNYRIEDVCTPEALAKNRKLVIDFYNMRRKELLSKQPNAGHLAIKNSSNISMSRSSPKISMTCTNVPAVPMLHTYTVS